MPKIHNYRDKTHRAGKLRGARGAKTIFKPVRTLHIRMEEEHLCP